MSQDRNSVKPVSCDGPYRHNPNRAMPPRVLAAPWFHAYLTGRKPLPADSEEAFRDCLDRMAALYPVVASGFMEGGHAFGGGFWLHTIWSHRPSIPDVVIVKGPGDVGYFALPYLYEQSRDETLLTDLTPIPLPHSC